MGDSGAVDPDAAARTLAARIADVPAHLARRVSEWVGAKYKRLSDRYGETGAKAILGAMVLLTPVPLPGTSLLPVAVAEAVLRIRSAVLQKAAGQLSEEQVRALARDLWHELHEEMGDERDSQRTPDGDGNSGARDTAVAVGEGDGPAADGGATLGGPDVAGVDDAVAPAARVVGTEGGAGVTVDPDPPADDADSSPDDTDTWTPDVVLLEMLTDVLDAAEHGGDAEAAAEKYRGAIDAMGGEPVEKGVKYDESKHPRGKDGRYIKVEDIHAAKSDPAKAAELRERVRPEDAAKLESALAGETDLGRTQHGLRREAAAGRRADKAATKARADELIGRLHADVLHAREFSADDLHALADHLPHMTVNDLKRARLWLSANFKGDTRRAQMVERLREYVKGATAEATPEVQAPAVEAKPEQAPEIPAATEVARPAEKKVALGKLTTVAGGREPNPWKFTGQGAEPHVLSAIQDAIKRAETSPSAPRPKLLDLYQVAKTVAPAITPRAFQEAMFRLQKDGRVTLGAWTLSPASMPDEMVDTAMPLNGDTKVYAESRNPGPAATAPGQPGDTAPPPAAAEAALDRPKLYRDLTAAVNAHADEHGSGARFDALYANVKRAHPALTPAEFKTALRKLDADGHLALTGWTESTDTVPDRGLDLWHHGGDAARDAEDKLYYHATPGAWHGATPKTADPGASAPTAAVTPEAAPAAPSAPPPADGAPAARPKTNVGRKRIADAIKREWTEARNDLARRHGTRKINDLMTPEEQAAESRVFTALTVLASGNEFDGPHDLGPVSDQRYAGYYRGAKEALAKLRAGGATPVPAAAAGDTPPAPQPPAKTPRAARKPKAVVPEAKLAKDPGADKAALQALAAAAPSDAARETILDAEHNVPGGDSQRNYAPAERRRYTVERLAAAWRDAHDRGDTASADYAAGALKQFGAELHGPEVGESTEFDGRRYDSEHSVASGPVKVLRRPVVLRYPDGGEHVAVKGLVGPAGGGEAGASGAVQSAGMDNAPQTGKPYEAVLHRGTGNDPKEAAKNRTPSQFGVGEYWSPHPEVAATYGPDVASRPVRLENPYVLHLDKKQAHHQQLRKEFGTHKPEEITKLLRARGHDGIIVTGSPVNRFHARTGEPVAMDDSTEVVRFHDDAKK